MVSAPACRVRIPATRITETFSVCRIAHSFAVSLKHQKKCVDKKELFYRRWEGRQATSWHYRGTWRHRWEQLTTPGCLQTAGTRSFHWKKKQSSVKFSTFPNKTNCRTFQRKLKTLCRWHLLVLVVLPKRKNVIFFGSWIYHHAEGKFWPDGWEGGGGDFDGIFSCTHQICFLSYKYILNQQR